MKQYRNLQLSHCKMDHGSLMLKSGAEANKGGHPHYETTYDGPMRISKKIWKRRSRNVTAQSAHWIAWSFHRSIRVPLRTILGVHLHELLKYPRAYITSRILGLGGGSWSCYWSWMRLVEITRWQWLYYTPRNLCSPWVTKNAEYSTASELHVTQQSVPWN